METERYGVTLPFSVFRSFSQIPFPSAILRRMFLLPPFLFYAKLPSSHRCGQCLAQPFKCISPQHIQCLYGKEYIVIHIYVKFCKLIRCISGLFMLAATFSSASGCFNAACTTSPSTEVRISFNATSSLAGQSFLILRFH